MMLAIGIPSRNAAVALPLARAGNQVERTGDPTAHAELLVIRAGALKLGAKRLTADHVIPLIRGGLFLGELACRQRFLRQRPGDGVGHKRRQVQ